MELLAIVFILWLIVLLLREVWTWWFKMNEVVSLLKQIRDNQAVLNKHITELYDDVTT